MREVPRIGEILRDMGILQDADIETILKAKSRSPRRFGHIAVDLGLASPEHVWEAWSRQLADGERFVDLSEIGVDSRAATCIPATLARFYRVVPLRLWGRNLVVAAGESVTDRTLTDLALFTGCQVFHCRCDQAQIDHHLQTLGEAAA